MSLIARELRVAFSKMAQPLWFRIIKWIVLLGLVVRFHAAPTFRWWALGLLLVGTALHFFYRWKTKAWTRAWGGWNDPDFERPRGRS